MKTEGFNHWCLTNNAEHLSHIPLVSDSRRECRMFKYKIKKFVLEMESFC